MHIWILATDQADKDRLSKYEETNVDICCFKTLKRHLNGFVQAITYRKLNDGLIAYEVYEGQMKNGLPSGFGRKISTSYSNFAFVGCFKNMTQTSEGNGVLYIDNKFKFKKYKDGS